MENIFTISYTIFLVALFLILFHKKTKRKNTKALTLPPGPKAFPLVGCLPQMLMNKPVFRWIHNVMDNLTTDLACFRIGSVHVFVVRDPKLACEFLKKQDVNFASRPACMAADLVSGGYLTAVMSPHSNQSQKMRKILSTEILNPATDRWLHDKRMSEADHLTRFVYNQCNDNNGGMVNLRVVTQHYCGNVIRRLFFNKRFFGNGMEDGGPGVEEMEHVDSLFTVLGYAYAFCVSDYFPFLRGYDLDGHEKIVKKAVHNARKYQDPLIDERIKQWKNGSRKQKEDLLDVLICLKDSLTGASVLSSDEVKAQVNELMLATVDNPSNATEWALAEMLNKPELLERATKEIDDVVGRGRLVNESDLSSLNYIKACAKESFRRHPIAPFNVPHVALVDTVVDGYTIPKGSHVLLSRPGLGRNPKVWEKPLEFMPERHLKSDGTNVVVLTDSELKILSFSSGRRGCLAVNLGTTITTMLLARLVQGFTWSVPTNMKEIDLNESKGDLFIAKPVVAWAKPRLAPHLYPVA